MSSFDPNAAAQPGSGIFGLPHGPDDAAVVLMPVPFAATVSFGTGAEWGPAAVLAASRQVDLYDHQVGRPYRRGIHLLDEDPEVLAWSESARGLAAPVIERGGAWPDDADAVAAVDRAGSMVNDRVRERIGAIFDAGQLPGVLGGDHSVPLGAIAAAAERHPGLGILHLDAHADLRLSYEGFRFSHASIMDNVLREVPGVARIVQVGIRDLCDQEVEAIDASAGRVVTHFDIDWCRRLASGEDYMALCREAVATLPEDVWISFDVDGLDPSLCPNTGTPVPGGLSFQQACLLLECLVEQGRRVVGFDLCEVAPGAVGEEGDSWDAAVGARLLYKLCGIALLAR